MANGRSILDVIRGVGVSPEAFALGDPRELEEEDVYVPSYTPGAFRAALSPLTQRIEALLEEEIPIRGVGARRGEPAVEPEPTPIETEGYWEWRDAKGRRHVSNVPTGVPERAKFKPFRKAVTRAGGVTVYGDITEPETGRIRPDVTGAITEAGETDVAAEERMVDEIVRQTGRPREEARRAYRESLAEVTGRPAAAAETYEDKVAIRNQIQQNVRDLYREATTDRERNQILRQANQLMKVYGVAELKRPEETIPTTIEGKRVNIPVSKYDPKKHGKGVQKVAEMPAAIRTFETVLGFKEKDRGTKKYQEEFMKFKSEASAEKMTRDKWRLKMGRKLIDEGFVPGEDDFEQQMENLVGFYDQIRPARREGTTTGERRPLSAFGG